MKRILLFLFVPLFALGCSAQQPQTTFQVNLAWTAPAICTTAAPCIFAVSRAPAVSGSCPATTGTAYALQGDSASQAIAFVDSAVAAGVSYCYIAQTMQGGATGPPSLPSNVVAVPTNPAAPGAPTAAAAVIKAGS